MKITLDLDGTLLARAKSVSEREGKRLATLIEEGLRLRLRARKPSPRAASRSIAIHHGKGGLITGVDPLSNRYLLGAADDEA